MSEVSRRYANALLSLVRQKGVHDKVLGELAAIQKIFQADESIESYFQNPLISPDQKTTVIKAAFSGKGLQEEVTGLLTLLAERGRLGRFDEIVAAFRESLDAEGGLTRGTVRAARPLSPEAMKNLEGKITTVLNKKIQLTFKEDPKILGGVIAEVGGWTFDDSIETHLKKMNEELNRRAH
jgi:F-type H+-transporting ATPase subunit delta